MVNVREFIVRVEEIAAEGPSYRHGGTGADGTCDCIGLIIGAIRRAGGRWVGTHGSNYAARSEVVSLERISSANQLTVGDAVFKAYEPSERGYELPGKYREGGASYTGDLRDYYHVGVVVSVNPLKIRHMTTPQVKMDYKVGKWSYHGWLKKITKEAVIPMGKAIDVQATVIGGTLNLRSADSTAASRVGRIPADSVVHAVEDLGEWVKVEYKGLTGYVMAKYLEIEGKPSGTMISVERARLELIYDELGDLLGLRG